MKTEYKIVKRDTYWAIVREMPNGYRHVAHVGDPKYIRKVWAKRYAPNGK